MEDNNQDQGQLFDMPEEPRRRTQKEIDEQIRQIGENADRANAERRGRGEQDEESQSRPGWAQVDSRQHVRTIIEVAQNKIARDEAAHQEELARRQEADAEDRP